MSRDRIHILLRKAHSLTGIVPIGIFLLVHLFLNNKALLGECNFTDGVPVISSLPHVRYLAILGIVVPIVFHGIFGLWMIIFRGRNEPRTYEYARDSWDTVQRLTGVLIFIFLGWHLWDTYVGGLTGRILPEQLYGHLLAGMSSSMVFLVMFVVGTVAASIHLANGAWGFCASRGILQSRRSQKVGSWVSILVGVVLIVAWVNIVFHFATGGPVGRENLIPVGDPAAECGGAPLTELDTSEG